MTTDRASAGAFGAPIWVSPFRPFYLLGAAYGPALILLWLGAYAELPVLPGLVYGLELWHGHEMVFGFSAAIISGILLTALPSWAGTPEIRHGRLALLVALWLAGRIAVWLAPVLPPALVGVADSALFLVMAFMVAPALFRVENKLYLATLPILLGLFLGNALFHYGAVQGVVELSRFGVSFAIYSIVLLYILKGGVLTPIFTGNRLRERGGGALPDFSNLIETLAVASVLAFILTGLGDAPKGWRAAAAFFAFAIHLWRMVRWKGWLVLDTPLLWTMHLGYLWLVLAFLLRGAGDLGMVPEHAWLHAFTVGALGPMMIGLMSRVVLRHTGRPMVLPRGMLVGCWAMLAATILRVAVSLFSLDYGVLFLSGLLWATPFFIYLVLFGAYLLAPSVPRQPLPEVR